MMVKATTLPDCPIDEDTLQRMQDARNLQMLLDQLSREQRLPVGYCYSTSDVIAALTAEVRRLRAEVG